LQAVETPMAILDSRGSGFWSSRDTGTARDATFKTNVVSDTHLVCVAADIMAAIVARKPTRKESGACECADGGGSKTPNSETLG
tara:strand:- start:572 stop:823 length:252 start_codon:yes stop_codon:yes gene_type:complete